jgi:serine/threonine protein kinase
MTSAATPLATLCPGCFADKGHHTSICPHCCYDESQKRGPLVLPHRTLLHNGQYLIGKVLGKPGGFGITYLAFDTKLETKVAIKEYLPRDLAGRDGDHATISAHSADDAEHFRYGLTQFLQEARTLARFDHANIVRVRNFFEENGTGYLVMDYYDGITLADYLAQQPQGKLPEKTAVDILMPILDGLREVHAKNFLHRDIKPQNIYLTTGNRAILLDFGAARQAMSERSRSLSVVLSEGYAPYEQYHRRGEQGPWTDIYASAAVLYHAVAGAAPPPATERLSKDELDIPALGVSARLAEALRLGLANDHKNRPQRMMAFQALLLEGSEPAAVQEKDLPNLNKVEFPGRDEIVRQNPIDSNQDKTKIGEKVFRAILALALVIVISFVVIANREEMKTVPTAAEPGSVEAKPGMKPISAAGSGNLKDTKTVPIVSEPGSVEATPEMKPVAAVGSGALKAATVRYIQEKKSFEYFPNSPGTTVFALINDKRIEVPGEEPGKTPVALIAQKDFNGDGIMDALVEITRNYGGSGQMNDSMFITVVDGKIVMAPVDGGKIVTEGGRSLVKSVSDDATEYWGFDGRKAIKVRSTQHRVLETTAEVKILNEYDENGTMDVDLDMDGKFEIISCYFWWRHQVYTSCTLPLPDGLTQKIDFVPDTYCSRVGVLKTQSNGYRELVCNNNSVIRFDGKAWVQLKPAP